MNLFTFLLYISHFHLLMPWTDPTHLFIIYELIDLFIEFLKRVHINIVDQYLVPTPTDVLEPLRTKLLNHLHNLAQFLLSYLFQPLVKSVLLAQRNFLSLWLLLWRLLLGLGLFLSVCCGLGTLCGRLLHQTGLRGVTGGRLKRRLKVEFTSGWLLDELRRNRRSVSCLC